ncbi:UNVERIFIED_CONTAM: M14 family metallopeptidase [Microbacterium sp. SLM126]
MPVNVERFGRPGSGPTVAVLGGVHGDEPEGVVAAGMLARALDGVDIRGEVRLVRVANEAAYSQNVRAASGDENLARVFPGNAGGSPAARVARHITDDVIAGADLLIDLHSAGTHYRMPLFVGYDTSAATAADAHRAAVAFGAPLIWRHRSVAPGRSLSAASALSVPAIYVESGGGGALRRQDLDAYLGGVLRVLALHGLIDTAVAAPGGIRFIDDGDGDVDSMLAAEHDGFCIVHANAGDMVEPGTLIAEILDETGRCVQRIVAEQETAVMMIRRTARIAVGEGVAMLAGVTG